MRPSIALIDRLLTALALANESLSKEIDDAGVELAMECRPVETRRVSTEARKPRTLPCMATGKQNDRQAPRALPFCRAATEQRALTFSGLRLRRQTLIARSAAGL